MSAPCRALGRCCVGAIVIAYGWALCYDAVMTWLDDQKREGA